MNGPNQGHKLIQSPQSGRTQPGSQTYTSPQSGRTQPKSQAYKSKKWTDLTKVTNLY